MLVGICSNANQLRITGVKPARGVSRVGCVCGGWGGGVISVYESCGLWPVKCLYV